MENQEPMKDIRIFRDMAEPLLAWYDKSARILPWRENTDPYRVWVSEIMLQQTRVEAVKPYFERFINHLPTIQSLADEKEEVLLKLWEGLGYYARVRNLQKSAKMICRDFGGVFPSSYDKICALPGIGAYTAGAIASISFGQPVPAVDGNVLRVVSRLTENDQDINDPSTKQTVKNQLQSVYPVPRSGDFTQSLMELGAVVCLPNGLPKCEECPLAFLCKAYEHHTQLSFPVKAKKQTRKQETKTLFLLCCGDKIAVRKRGERGLLEGLWEFPNADGILTSEEIKAWLKDFHLDIENIEKTEDKSHIFTHITWKMQGYIVQCKAMNTEFIWVTKEDIEKNIALPAAFKKFLPCWPLYRS